MSPGSGMPPASPPMSDRPDVIVARLTARQVVILAGTGLAVWGAFMAAHAALPHVPPVYLIAPAAPVAAIAFGLALGKRDGLSADRFAQPGRAAPRAHTQAPGGRRRRACTAAAAGPGRAAAGKAGPAPAPMPMPGRREIDDTGVVDLGGEGYGALAACGTVNFALRTPGEQDALVASFGRWLNGLTAPVQLLVRTHRLDLTEALAQLREAAPGLPHPALEAAASEHLDYLQALAGRRDVLHRQVLLTVREPRAGRKGNAGSADASAPQRLHRRLDEAARALAGSQIPVRAFDNVRLRHLLTDAAGAGREPTEGDSER